MARILGISAFYHDSAAALVVDGRLASWFLDSRSARQLVRLLLDQGLMSTPPSMNQWLDPQFLPQG